MKKSWLMCVVALVFPLFVLAHGGVNDDELIIRMTENGFEPKELTAVEGDKVLFINNDDTNRWPASNFHPTHGLYPEFDPLTGIKPGDSWTMTFTKTGKWRMHDHLLPHMTGTITVLPDPEKGSETEVEKASPSEGEVGFWQKLKAFFLKLFRVEPKVKMVVKSHDDAHLWGQKIFEKRGLEGLSECTPQFAFGCYHGLLEVAFDHYKDKPDSLYQEAFSSVEAACREAESEDGPYVSCIHGIGHGTATFREYDLDKSLSDCALLGQAIRPYCYDGVFMEFSISAPRSYYKKSDPLYPCNAIGEEYRGACARSQARIMRDRLDLNTTQIALLCRESGSAPIRYHCIDSLGYYAAQTAPTQPGKVITTCEEIVNGDDQAQCKAAAAGELIFQNYSGWQESSPKVCESMKANYLTACLSRIEQIKTAYGRK